MGNVWFKVSFENNGLKQGAKRKSLCLNAYALTMSTKRINCFKYKEVSFDSASEIFSCIEVQWKKGIYLLMSMLDGWEWVGGAQHYITSGSPCGSKAGKSYSSL